MSEEDFERLEKANARWDVLIDQEEYGKIYNSIKFRPEKHSDYISEAFSHEYCTNNLDNEWYTLFGNNGPTASILNLPDFEITLDTNRASFFLAKLIRARIQEKGSDCYFRRLDQHIIFYLERSMPGIAPEDKPKTKETTEKTKLIVLYLLEMAAAGTGPDQRSFAERGRRMLELCFNKEDYFYKFYELLARYNIGVGYQHEGRKRKAVQEFNYIIYELNKIYDPKSGSALSDDKKEWKSYADDRKGFELLFIPALLGRSAIQVKLQLAYHAIKTLDSIFKLIQINGNAIRYFQAKINILKAEAYRLKGDFRRSKEALTKISEFLGIGKKLGVNEIITWKTSKYTNIMGRLVDTFIALRVEQVINDNGNEASSFAPLLKKYWETAKLSATDREGYLLITSEILAVLAKKSKQTQEKERESILGVLKKIYDVNRERLLDKENQISKGCKYCDRKGIDIRKISSKHYEDFRKYLTSFYTLYNDDSRILGDKKDFGNRLKQIEKDRENLEWRKREIDYALCDSGDLDSWCTTCVPSTDTAFCGLLTCRPRDDGGDKNKRLTDSDYEHIMDTWDKHFLDHLKSRSVHEQKTRSLQFLGLQRWNSTSPAQGRSVGGGYFVYHTDKKGSVDCGIAIDPGFDFVRNLFHVGFSLSDIDLVLLSHAHIDHIRDFESMVNLYLELDKRKKRKRRPHVIMTLGIYRRLAHIIESPGLRKYMEPYIIDIEKELYDDRDLSTIEFLFRENKCEKSPNALIPSFNDNNEAESEDDSYIKVRPIIAYHNDFTEYSDSFGFNIKIKTRHSQKPFCFGYTGDTGWHQGIMNQYKDCDAVLVHLGSLIDRKDKERKKFSYYSKSERCWEIAVEKNHPYLMGVLHFFRELQDSIDGDRKPPLVLMSEFGEELRGGIRLDIVKRLRTAFQPIEVLPVDVGLDVLLQTDANGNMGGFCQQKSSMTEQDGLIVPSVLCAVCNEFVELKKVDFETYGHDEALFFICETCKKSTPVNVLQERLKTLYEVGRSLRKDESGKNND